MFFSFSVILDVGRFIGSLLFVAVIKHDDQKLLVKEKVYLAYTSTAQPTSERNHMGTQARTESETMEEHGLLVAPHGLLNLLS